MMEYDIRALHQVFQSNVENMDLSIHLIIVIIYKKSKKYPVYFIFQKKENQQS